MNTPGEILRDAEARYKSRDHNTKARQDWLKQMRRIMNKYDVYEDSTRTSRLRDKDITTIRQEHCLTGILAGVVLMLWWVWLLDQFPTVCG